MLIGILAVGFLLGQSELPINFITILYTVHANHEYQMLCTNHSTKLNGRGYI